MLDSRRHWVSVGGRERPPPKYCSYSILSVRISRSMPFRSSSMVAIVAVRYPAHAGDDTGLSAYFAAGLRSTRLKLRMSQREMTARPGGFATLLRAVFQ